MPYATKSFGDNGYRGNPARIIKTIDLEEHAADSTKDPCKRLEAIDRIDRVVRLLEERMQAVTKIADIKNAKIEVLDTSREENCLAASGG